MISLINDGVVVFVTTKLYFISFISEGSVVVTVVTVLMVAMEVVALMLLTTN